PEEWKEKRCENRNTHQGADDEKPPTTLLYHLSIAAFAFHTGEDSFIYGYRRATGGVLQRLILLMCALTTLKERRVLSRLSRKRCFRSACQTVPTMTN